MFLQQYVFVCEMFCPFQWIRRKETKKSWGSLGEKQVWIRLKDFPLAAMFTDLDFSSPKFDFLFISLSQRRWCKCNISSAKIPSEMEVAPRYKLLTLGGGVITPRRCIKVKISSRHPPNLIPTIDISHFA